MSLLNLALRLTRFIALAAAIILLASTLDNIPDCPELLNYGTQKTTALTAHHDLVPVAVALDRVTWQKVPRDDGRVFVADPMRVTPPCFVRVAQHAADPSPPAVLV